LSHNGCYKCYSTKTVIRTLGTAQQGAQHTNRPTHSTARRAQDRKTQHIIQCTIYQTLSVAHT